MFIKYNKNPIITPDYKLNYEKECTYNPCAVVHDNKVFLIYRAEGKCRNYISTLCLATSNDGYNFNKYEKNPILKPSRPEEKRGCEDPRITKIGDVFYLTYTAFESYDERGGKHKIALSLATSKDLINWEKHGVIFDNMKAGYIYPEKINGEYLMFVGEGSIRIAGSKNLQTWRLEEKPLLSPRENHFDSKLVEVGPPFIIIKNKLIMIYNTADRLNRYLPHYVVLDRKNPTKIIYRHDKPLLGLSEQFEYFGKTNNVIFAEGLVNFAGKYFLYYGGADKYIGVATINEDDLTNYL